MFSILHFQCRHLRLLVLNSPMSMLYFFFFFFPGCSMFPGSGFIKVPDRNNNKRINAGVLYLFFISNLKSRSHCCFTLNYSIPFVFVKHQLYIQSLVMWVPKGISTRSLGIYSKVGRQDTYIKEPRDRHYNVIPIHNIVTLVLQPRNV